MVATAGMAEGAAAKEGDVDGDGAESISRLTVKQMRDAMALAEGSVELEEGALRKARAAVVRHKRLWQKSASSFEANLATVMADADGLKVLGGAATQEDMLVSNCKLSMSLRKVEDVDDITSYGLYERWRRCLDERLCAGGAVVRADDPSACLADVRHGYVGREDVELALRDAKGARRDYDDVAKELVSCREKAHNLRKEVWASDTERLHLRQEVEEQEQCSEQWWRWHLSTLPAHSEQLERASRAESSITTLRAECIDARRSSARLDAEAAEAEASLHQARVRVEAQEAEMHRFRNYAETYGDQAAALHQRGTQRSAAEAARLDEVRRGARRLEKVRRFCDEVGAEHREARRAEAQAGLERQNFAGRAAQVRTELQDARQHLDMVRSQRTATVRALGEREQERQELWRAHTSLALDLERSKFALSAARAPERAAPRRAVASLPPQQPLDAALARAVSPGWRPSAPRKGPL